MWLPIRSVSLVLQVLTLRKLHLVRAPASTVAQELPMLIHRQPLPVKHAFSISPTNRNRGQHLACLLKLVWPEKSNPLRQPWYPTEFARLASWAAHSNHWPGSQHLARAFPLVLQDMKKQQHQL
jgi:hypothetical protein